MIGFSFEEIYGSMLYAITWGAVFCAAFSLCGLILGIVGSFGRICRVIFVYEKIFAPPTKEELKIVPRYNALLSFVSVLIFTLGFAVVSYFSLDGVIRLYMLILSFASFYLSKIVFFDFLNKAIGFILSSAFLLLCPLVRLLIYPVKLLVRSAKRMIK